MEIRVPYCDFKAVEESKQGPIFLLPSLKYSKIPRQTNTPPASAANRTPPLETPNNSD